MEILAHRGIWTEKEEQNTIKSLFNSFISDFGIETDVRDFGSDLVISHDIPRVSSLLLKDLFTEYKNQGFTQRLALNIKSDGLAQPLFEMLNDYGINNYFVFDMSVPDTLHYLKSGMKTFTRFSEIEPNPLFLKGVSGLWVDAFYSDWFVNESSFIEGEKLHGLELCFVSPELHKRQHQTAWAYLKELSKVRDLILCTDFPNEAEVFFNGKN